MSFKVHRALAGLGAICLVISLTAQTQAGIVALVDNGGQLVDALNYLDNVFGNVPPHTSFAKDDVDPDDVGDDEMVYDSDAGETPADVGGDKPDLRAASWQFASSMVPGYFTVKFDSLIAIYSYMGPNSSPYMDSYDLDADVWDPTTGELLVPIVDVNGNVLVPEGSVDPGGVYNLPGGGTAVPKATTSNVALIKGGPSIIQPPVPEAGALSIWALVGISALVIGRRRMRS